MIDIKYDEVLMLLKNEFTEVMEDNYQYYKDYKIVMALEQEYIKNKDVDPRAIYIVLSFSNSSVNFAQTVIPVTITAISEQNKIETCQRLLLEFVHKYNLIRVENDTIQQVYESPVVTSNFNKLFDGFRSVLYVTGYLVISKTANFFTIGYVEEKLEKPAEIIDEADSENVRYEIIDSELLEEKLKENDNILEFKKTGYTNPQSYGEGNNISAHWRINNDNDAYLKFYKDYEEGVDTWFSLIFTNYGVKILMKYPNNSTEQGEEYTIRFVFEEEEISTTVHDIPLISCALGGTYQLDSQPFFFTKNYSTSISQTGTLVITMTTFLLDDIKLINDVLDILTKEKEINYTFKLKVSFKNKEFVDNFKLSSAELSENIGEIPGISLAFSN